MSYMTSMTSYFSLQYYDINTDQKPKQSFTTQEISVEALKMREWKTWHWNARWKMRGTLSLLSRRCSRAAFLLQSVFVYVRVIRWKNCCGLRSYRLTTCISLGVHNQEYRHPVLCVRHRNSAVAIVTDRSALKTVFRSCIFYVYGRFYLVFTVGPITSCYILPLHYSYVQQYSTVGPYNTIQYNAIQYNIIQYNII